MSHSHLGAVCTAVRNHTAYGLPMVYCCVTTCSLLVASLFLSPAVIRIHSSCFADVQSSARGVSAPQPLGLGGPWGVCPHWGGGFHGWGDPPYHIPCCHHDGGQSPCMQCLIMLTLFLFLFRLFPFRKHVRFHLASILSPAPTPALLFLHLPSSSVKSCRFCPVTHADSW